MYDRLQITITINMRTHNRRKNHYEKIPLSIYIILVLYYRDKPYIITHPKQTEQSICNRNL